MHHLFRLGLLSLFVAAISACNSNKSTLAEPLISAIPTQQIIETVTGKTDSSDKQLLIPMEDPYFDEYVSIMPIPECPPPCDPPLDTYYLTSLSDELNRLKPKEQVFQFDASKGAQITCAEGTILNIPAGAFSADGINTTNGIITFKVTEYYVLSDIIASGLHTNSDKGRLESGGMVYLEARQGAKNLELFNNKGISIRFADYKPDMQTFVTSTQNGEMIWVLANNTLGADVAMTPTDNLIDNASFPGGNEAYLEYKKENLTYPDSAFNNCITGIVGMQFLVTADGNIDAIQIVKSAHPMLDEAATLFIRNMPAWKPAKINLKDTASTIYLELNFSPVDFVTTDELKNGKKWNRIFNFREDQDVFLPDCITWEEIGTLNANTNLSATPVTIKKNLYQITAGIILTMELGYINCDRFVNTGRKEVNLTINLPKLGENRVSLIFPNMRSVMTGSVNRVDGRAYIYNVDEGMETQLLVLREENGTLYYCVMPIITGATPIITPVLTPVGYDQLDTVLKALDEDKMVTIN